MTAVAAPLADRRGYFDGTFCANCGRIISRLRHPRPGRTFLLGDWVHEDAGIVDPRPCRPEDLDHGFPPAPVADQGPVEDIPASPTGPIHTQAVTV